MICTKCGNELGQKKFCPYCGAMVINTVQYTANTAAQNTVKTQKKPAAPNGAAVKHNTYTSGGTGQRTQTATASPKKYNLLSAYKSMFKNYANFDGRSCRSEFWFALLMNYIIILATELIFVVPSMTSFTMALLTGRFSAGIIIALIASSLLGIYSLGILVPSLALIIRRLHDIGKSWVYILMGLIPLAGPIILIVFMATDSQPGSNMFGSNPKGM